jgi:hypothetical protein
MAPVSKRVGRRFVNLGSAMLLGLGLAALGAGAAQAQGAAEPAAAAKSGSKSEPKVESKPAPTTGEKRPVKENIKQLGREASDPTTLQRIKAHEQDLEKRVESRRERQRKDHGAARPSDAVDLAKNLDKSEGAATPVKPEAKVAAKTKAAPAPPPAPPAAAKPAPAPK